MELVAQNGGRAATEAPAPVSSSGGLIEGLDAADVERGLGRGGPVRTAVELAAHTENAPTRGSATFSVTVSSDGRIDVQVTSNQTDWAQLIPVIREAVGKVRVRLHSKSRGLRVVVAVEAKVKYPNGYEPPPDAPSFDTRLALDRNEPLVRGDARGRRCWAHWEVAAGGVSAAADCAAGVLARGVATRIVSERRL